ncbi:MAG: GTP-binding protein [Candidatus Anaerobiospirillum merdipullorum]|uniref:GTP-binding protein n=1 Tax=Candidatus Anaerobiospirillum merdipullorum TaxID=2838450 RepID=A0A9E2KPP6_9GAMM|nr:GTP-binding protein [Candidatus Anaerobiospirillum merdipullorum]
MSDIIVEEEQLIPVNIITGFLGSGKTTLLNHWVNTPEFKDTLVLINEFGDVGLDHELVQAVDDTVVLLGSGCICCTLQGELVDALATNYIKAQRGQMPAFNRVLIETTGLADPAGVISTLGGDDFLMQHYRYNGTITILDAEHIREQLKKQYEAVKQIALADLILISKTDLVDADEIDAIAEAAQHINHSAKIYPVLNGRISPTVVQEIGPYREDRTQNIDMVKQWLSYQDKSIASPFRPATVGDSLGLAKPKIIAHSNIESFSLVVKEPLEPLALLAAISLVQQQYGDSILRIKGILNLKGQDKPVIIHGVQGSLYPLTELDSWPDNEQVSKLVFIVRATVKEQIEHIFKQALEHPDEASLAYYQQIIDAADLSGSATDNNQA